MFDKYSDVCMSFAYQLYEKLKKNFNKDIILIVKKELLPDVIFDILPFRFYDHFYNCDRGFYVHNKCKENTLSEFLNENLMFNYGLLPSVLVENFDFLENGVQFFVHYHGIMFKGRDKNFDNNCGNFGVMYFKSVNSPSMLYNAYLEILCRVIFNSLLQKEFEDVGDIVIFLEMII